MVIRNNTWTALSNALAQISAEFPAGDNHLKPGQNRAVNSLLDAIFLLKNESPEFGKSVVDAYRKVERRSLLELRNSGRISQDEYTRALGTCNTYDIDIPDDPSDPVDPDNPVNPD